jgi:hypothetical protein
MVINELLHAYHKLSHRLCSKSIWETSTKLCWRILIYSHADAQWSLVHIRP